MQLTILEPYASLAYRTIKLGLTARQSAFHTRPVVASSSHLKLLEHQRGINVDNTYVWAVLDGFFLATPTFEKYHLQGAFESIGHIYAVGDLGGLDRLRARVGRPVELLLDAAICDALVDRLAVANPWRRLRFGLLPASAYTINDRLKSWRQSRTLRDTVSRRGGLLFAGNKGVGPVREMLSTCVERPLETNEIDAISAAFSTIHGCGSHSADAAAAEIAGQVCAAFDALKRSVELSIAHSRNAAFPFDDYGISMILYKALFRYAVLERLRWLQLVETIHPPHNVSVYTRPRFKLRRMLDFGGINGFEALYPRSLDCRLYGKRMMSFNATCQRAFLNGRPDERLLVRMLLEVFAVTKNTDPVSADSRPSI
jgi:hypothetical protein